MNEDDIEIDEFDDFDDQGFGPNDYMNTMGLQDDDGPFNDDFHFLGHD